MTLDGRHAAFRDCGVSVRFSGTPRELHANETAAYTSALGRNLRWQVDGLAYTEFRYAQTALCACRNVQFSDADIEAAEASIARNANVKTLPVATPPFARRTIGIDAPYSASGYAGDQALLLFPQKAPRCVFVQGGKFAATAPEAIRSFFATLQPVE